MLPYFLVYSPLAYMATIAPARRVHVFSWVLMFLLIVVFVGLRHHVGMDWNNYLHMIVRANRGDWSHVLTSLEPGYSTILYISGQMGWGIYGAYLIGTFIFALGLFRYAKSTPFPWIALVVSFPYLVVVVSMSGARQAVAIGVLLWLFSRWNKSSTLQKVILIVFAATFHNSAIVFLGLIALDDRLRFAYRVFLAALSAALVIYLIRGSEAFSFYQQVYFAGSGSAAAAEAGGALFHVLLNAGPAAAVLVFLRQVRNVLLPDSLHRGLAYIALCMVPIALITSVGASRFSVYLFPVSMMIVSSLPLLMKRTGERQLVRFLIAIFYLLVLVVWLFFANNSRAWHNYSNALLVDRELLIFCCQ